MTKSSSVALCVRTGRLHRIGDELVEEDEECRCEVYGTDRFVDWRDGTLPYFKPQPISELTPDEEVDDFLRRFQLGRRATEMARLRPTKHGIWEIRLPQTRLFGWFPEPNVLVLGSGADISTLKRLGRKEYDRHAELAREERQNLGVDYVAGDQTVVRPSLPPD